MAKLILLPGKERSVYTRHPWLFATSVGRMQGRASSGDTVQVFSDRGEFLGRAAYSPESQIRARFWTFNDETVDDAFFKRRVAAAIARRKNNINQGKQCTAQRLIHAEADGLPGVVADEFGDTVVLQLTSAGADKWRNTLAQAIQQYSGCTRIFERSDSAVRLREGLSSICGWLIGGNSGDLTQTLISEAGVNFTVNFATGHKTGFYLDQRDNRLLLQELVADKRVLNAFCYTGGFSLHALAGGAISVLSLDSSEPAIALAKSNLLNNNPGLPATRCQWLEADAFTALRDLHKKGENYDVVVLDPPKFAPSAAHARRAAKAYRDINMAGLRLVAEGGLLLTFSCSGGMGSDLFQHTVAAAARDAGRSVRLLKRLGASADHPVDLNVPESEYLKGLLLQVE